MMRLERDTVLLLWKLSHENAFSPWAYKDGFYSGGWGKKTNGLVFGNLCFGIYILLILGPQTFPLKLQCPGKAPLVIMGHMLPGHVQTAPSDFCLTSSLHS